MGKKNPQTSHWLALDVGSSYTKLYASSKIRLVDRCESSLLAIQNLLENNNLAFHHTTQVFLSSVQSKDLTQSLATHLSSKTKKLVQISPCQLPFFQSNYAIEQLGTDRWLQMLGLHSKPERKLESLSAIFSFGTAITLDVVWPDSEKACSLHEGGKILPNRHALAQALKLTTSLPVPQLHGELQACLTYANTTKTAIESGIHSLLGLWLEREIQDLEEKSKRQGTGLTIYFTGGEAEIWSQYLATKNPQAFRPILDNMLIYKGLGVYSSLSGTSINA